MNPPLRSQTDADALLDGIADGTLSILCSDHAPHADFEKEVEFDVAPFGIIGLETELGLFIDLLVHKHAKIDIVRLIEMYTIEPARLLKLDAGTLSPGARADVTLVDSALEWTVSVDQFQSVSRNSPFNGWQLKGRAVEVIFKVCDCSVLAGNNVLDEVPDRDHTHHLIAFDHGQVPNVFVGH